MSTIAKLVYNVPPSIAFLSNGYKVQADIIWFQQTTRRLLPDVADYILGRDSDAEQFISFAEAFGERYFPLTNTLIYSLSNWEYDMNEGELNPWGILKGGPPFELFGFTIYSDDMDQATAPAHLLMLTLMQDPTPSWLADDAATQRLALFEEAMEHVNPELLARIPEPPWRPQQVHQALDDAGMDDAAMLSRWLDNDTGVWLADAYFTEECLYDPTIYQEGWDDDYITEMTQQWTETEAIIAAVNRATQWIQDDPTAAMNAIISAIELHVVDNPALSDEPKQETEP